MNYTDWHEDEQEIEIDKNTTLFLAAVSVQLMVEIRNEVKTNATFRECIQKADETSLQYVGNFIEKKIPSIMRQQLIQQSRLLDDYSMNPSKYTALIEEIYNVLRGEK